MYRLIEINVLLCQPLFAQGGVKRASHNGQDPGARIVSLELIEKTESSYIGCLYHVFRSKVIAREPARQAIRRIKMGQGQLFKALVILFLGQMLTSQMLIVG